MSEQTQPPVPPVPPVPAAQPAAQPPAPQYGEYAPAASGYSYTQPPVAEPTTRRRRTWDVVLTCILLVLGLFGAIAGIAYGVALPLVFGELYRQQDLGTYTDDGSLAMPGAILWISHLLLYLLVLGLSIPMLIARKVTFWIPLTAGVIAAIIFWVTMFTVVLGDPLLGPSLLNTGL